MNFYTRNRFQLSISDVKNVNICEIVFMNDQIIGEVFKIFFDVQTVSVNLSLKRRI